MINGQSNLYNFININQTIDSRDRALHWWNEEHSDNREAINKNFAIHSCNSSKWIYELSENAFSRKEIF